MRVVLVGERTPAGTAGARRLCAILGLGRGNYARAFHRINLFGPRERWSVPLARERASAIALAHGPTVAYVLLGRRVWDAFAPHHEWLAVVGPSHASGKYWIVAVASFTRRGRFVFLPHPSGRCRAWNNPQAAQWARELVLPLIGKVAA